MLKIWLLIIMTSTPNWPSVKTLAEVHFTEQSCQARQPVVEEILIDKGLRQGYSAIWVETWCLETDMFNPNKV
jgi:hypothetical protein